MSSFYKDKYFINICIFLDMIDYSFYKYLKDTSKRLLYNIKTRYLYVY